MGIKHSNMLTSKEQESSIEDVSTPIAAAAAIVTLMGTRERQDKAPPEGPSDTNYENIGHNNRARSTKLLKDLCIEDITSFRFGIKDILSVSRNTLDNDESKTSKEKTLKDKILFAISKIVIGDCSSRNMLLCTKRSQEAGDAENVVENDTDDGDDDLFSIIKSKSEMAQNIIKSNSEDTEEIMHNELHPSDAIVIIMNCCDNILKEILIKKMVMCQVAIPLTLPNLFNNEQMFLLWALRHLNLEWKAKPTGVHKENPIDNPTPIDSAIGLGESAKSKSGVHKENPVEYPIPIVSAIRLGDLSKSKSYIVNGILSNQEHNIFFQKDCEGGSLSRKLSNGVVELAWYLPRDSKDESFNEIWTIANLRGDALEYHLQFDLLNKISSVMLIFLTKESLCHSFDILEKLSTSNQQLIFVFLDVVNPTTDKNKKDIEKESFRKLMTLMENKEFIHIRESVNGKKKNGSTLNTEIKNRIKESLISVKTGKNKRIFSLKQASDIAKDIGINIDENNDYCCKGNELANYVISILDSNNVEDRNTVLPLQGELWLEWSRLSKQHARRKNPEGMSPEDFDSKMYHEKKRCRDDQFKLVENMTEQMKKLTSFNEQNLSVTIYFLQWVKMYLDARSKKLLPSLHNNYHKLWGDIQNKLIKDESDSLRKLENLEKKIILGSFGLEHFMREIGQVYEASFYHKKNDFYKILLNNLPMCAADLLINGFPLEIMDGDAGQMPKIWLEAVFDALSLKLKDKRVYVISILGLQSSGKSTLLNMMFGFNFAVGAARCTKGVFAQLISIDENLAQDLGFEYILVLDTEGLRAAELRNHMRWHDNEIATLVIAMGDVTIVNLMGENTSEIEDILQISVHAFLRMRIANNSTKKKPGCYFVHQNVSDANASNAMQFSYEKLKKTLDTITSTAAKHEDVNEIQSFDDIIEFDVNKQIWYFPGLWKGSPPMAPINPSYSDKAFDFKNKILKFPSKKDVHCLTFSKLKGQMSNLWDALLKENFVFSFKNSLELQCFTHLEKKILSLCMEFRKNVYHERHNFSNRIHNCQMGELSSYQVTVVKDFKKYIETCHEDFENKLKVFLNNSKEKDIIMQWEFSAVKKIKDLKVELITEAEIYLKKLFEIRKIEYDQTEQISEYIKKIQELVEQIVRTDFDLEMDDESPSTKFEKQWTDWIQNLSFPKIQDEINISAEVWKVFEEVFQQHHAICIQSNQGEKFDFCHLDDIPSIDGNDFIEKASKNDYSSNLQSKKTNGKEIKDIEYVVDTIKSIKNHTLEIMKKIEDYLGSIEHMDFDNNCTWKIHEIFKQMIHNFNEGNQKFNLSVWYKVKVFVHILKNIIPCFIIMHDEYLKKRNPRNILEVKYKHQVHNVFIGTYTKCRKEIIAAGNLRDLLLPAINVSVKDCLPEKISFNLMLSKKEFHSKPELYRKVLVDLRKVKDFNEYIIFINQPDRAFMRWIEKYVSDYCMEMDANGKSMLGREANETFKNKVTELIACVQQALENSERKLPEFIRHTQTSESSDCQLTELNECIPMRSENLEISFQVWISKFKDLAKEIIPLSNTLHNIFDMKAVEVKDVHFFVKEFIKMLNDLKKNQENKLYNMNLEDVKHVDKPPHKLISDLILGCMKYCPFCGVICSSTINHPGKDHTAPRHYPGGIMGCHDRQTKVLSLKSCNELVATIGNFRNEFTNWKSVNYKEYRMVNENYASWSIAADTSLEASLYWKWVFAQFAEQFADFNNTIDGVKLKCPQIPSEWKNIKEEDIDESISIMFK